jgi:hypothetical protein
LGSVYCVEATYLITVCRGNISAYPVSRGEKKKGSSCRGCRVKDVKNNCDKKVLNFTLAVVVGRLLRIFCSRIIFLVPAQNRN